jgi:carbon monoxide dehydrogenase subunit G
MQLEHEFHVPVPVAQAWDVLLDVERIAPCMPGASVQSFDGENVEGRVKVKVGPIQVTYAGSAKFVDRDEANHRVTIDAKGKEARGSGTAAASIVTQLYDEGESTRVTVTTDLAITGKPAQFGRGVMVEVGNKLLGLFADCLAEEISGEGAGASGAAAGAGSAPAAAAAAGGAGAVADTASDTATGGDAAGEDAAVTTAEPSPSPQPVASPTPSPAPRPVARETQPLDLLDAAGPALAKRLVPLLVGLLVLLLVWRRVQRR